MFRVALLSLAITLALLLLLLLPLIRRALSGDPVNDSDSSHRWYGRNHP